MRQSILIERFSRFSTCLLVPVMLTIQVVLFLSFPSFTVSQNEGTIIAFGDWGFVSGIERIRKLNKFIRTNTRFGIRQDFVCLLGGNFYPSGIDLSLGFTDPMFGLFSNVLAKNLSTVFVATLGNHDHYRPHSIVYQHNCSSIDSRWLMGGLLSGVLARPFGDPPIRSMCVWQTDSIQFTRWHMRQLDEQIAKTIDTCRWTIMMSHYPVFTFGHYKFDRSIDKFRDKIFPLLQKYKIHVYLSGHEHSAQLISVCNMSTLFVTAGSRVDVRRGQYVVKDTQIVRQGEVARLDWFSDSRSGIVARIKYSSERFILDFVDFVSSKHPIVLKSVVVDA
jgi:hypothetical protein